MSKPDEFALPTEWAKHLRHDGKQATNQRSRHNAKLAVATGRLEAPTPHRSKTRKGIGPKPLCGNHPAQPPSAALHLHVCGNKFSSYASPFEGIVRGVTNTKLFVKRAEPQWLGWLRDHEFHLSDGRDSGCNSRGWCHWVEREELERVIAQWDNGHRLA